MLLQEKQRTWMIINCFYPYGNAKQIDISKFRIEKNKDAIIFMDKHSKIDNVAGP